MAISRRLQSAYASFSPSFITSVWSLCERETLLTFGIASRLLPNQAVPTDRCRNSNTPGVPPPVQVLKSWTTYASEIHVRPNTLDLEFDAKSISEKHGASSCRLKLSEKDAHGARRYSVKEKFRSDLNRPESCKMSERLLKTLRKFADFQAEYDGSIPVTCLEPGMTIPTWLPWELLDQTIAMT